MARSIARATTVASPAHRDFPRTAPPTVSLVRVAVTFAGLLAARPTARNRHGWQNACPRDDSPRARPVNSRPRRRLLQVRVSEAKRTSPSTRRRHRRRGDHEHARERHRRLGSSDRARSLDERATEATPSGRHVPTPAPTSRHRGSLRRSRTDSRKRERLQSHRYRTVYVRTGHTRQLLGP